MFDPATLTQDASLNVWIWCRRKRENFSYSRSRNISCFAENLESAQKGNITIVLRLKFFENVDATVDKCGISEDNARKGKNTYSVTLNRCFTQHEPQFLLPRVSISPACPHSDNLSR